jgi:hypothetical protein
MALRWNGGVLGKPAFPNTGMWSLPAQLDRRQRSRWPIPLPVTGNLILHIDASQPSTVTLNGSNVSAITDLSPSGHTVNQTTSARQPAYVRDVRNGRNVIRFTSASQHYLDVTSITIPASHTVFTVWSRDDRTFANISLGNAPERYPHIWWTDQSIYQQSNGSATTQTTGTRNNGNATGWFYFTTRRDGTTSIRARQNGVNYDVTSGTGVTSAASGSWIYIGRISSSPSYAQCDIGEIIAYDTALSDADISLVESYISAKWNI